MCLTGFSIPWGSDAPDVCLSPFSVPWGGDATVTGICLTAICNYQTEPAINNKIQTMYTKRTQL